MIEIFEHVCKHLQNWGHSQRMAKEMVQNTDSISLRSQVLLGASREKVFPNALRQRSDIVKILITLTDLPEGYICTELHEPAPFLQIRNVFSDCISVSASRFVGGTLKRFHLCIIFHISCNGFLPRL